MPRKERFDELRIATPPVAGENPVRLRDIDDLNLDATGDVTDGGYTEAIGDGTTATFEWATTATDPIQWAHITPTTEAASADYHVDVSSGTVTVTYATAPPNGDALGWFWAVGDSSGSTTTDEDSATQYARYITLGDESADLPDSVNHANVTGAENLHAPKAHGDEAHNQIYLKPQDAEDFAAALHGDAAHSETYLKTADVAGKADDPHGNEAHDSNYATTTAIGTKADEPHGNEAHSSEYATTTAVTGKANDPHGDGSHDATVASSANLSTHISATGDVHGIAGTDEIAGRSDIDSHASVAAGVHGIASTDSVAAQSEVNTKAPKDGGGVADLTNYDTISATTVVADNLSAGGGGGSLTNVKDYGAVGDGTTDDTTAFQDAMGSLTTGGILLVPAGTYILTSHLTVPRGVVLKGEGRDATTLKSEDTGGKLSFTCSTESGFYDLTLDQNAAGRGHANTTGIKMQAVDHCRVERCNFVNISTSSEGVCIYLDCEETDPQDTHNNVIRDCHFQGTWQNGSNSGDFLIRARTAFNKDLETANFTRFLRDNLVENCTFSGEGKAALEFVGPATVENRAVNCTARNFTTCTGIFESSLGAKRTLFIGCSILDCYGDSTCIGFYSDGHTNTGTPNRWAEDDLYLGCRVDGFHQTSSGSDIRGFRARRTERIKFADCIAENITTNSTTGKALGFYVNSSSDVIIDSPRIRNTEWGITASGASALNVNNPNFIGTSIEVNELSSNTRPRWNDVLGGGYWGGVDLSTTSGNNPGDEAMSNGNDAAFGLKAVWTGSSWRVSDGTVV